MTREASGTERIDRFMSSHGLDELRETIAAVPAGLRRSSDGRSARDIVIELANLRSPVPNDLPEDMAEAIHAIHDRQDVLRESIVLRAPLTRPKGHRPAILAQGVAFARNAFGIEVTARFVDRCWKQARAIERQIASDI